MAAALLFGKTYAERGVRGDLPPRVHPKWILLPDVRNAERGSAVERRCFPRAAHAGKTPGNGKTGQRSMEKNTENHQKTAQSVTEKIHTAQVDPEPEDSAPSPFLIPHILASPELPTRGKTIELVPKHDVMLRFKIA